MQLIGCAGATSLPPPGLRRSGAAAEPRSPEAVLSAGIGTPRAAPGERRRVVTFRNKTLDQHAGHEKNRLGRPICDRGGLAVDLRVPGVDSKTVADWIVANTPYDRLYYYGADRPLHVSVGPDAARAVAIMRPHASGRLIPRVVDADRFLRGDG